MDKPIDVWYNAIFNRVSRRNFEPQGLSREEVNSFTQFCVGFRPFPGVRAVLSTDAADVVFKGAIGSYGKVKGARVFVAFIGDAKDPNILEKIGYFGESIILEATARGFGTCWVGGYFRPDIVSSVVSITGGEKIFAVTPVGYPLESYSREEKWMRMFINAHKRLPATQLVTGLELEKWPDWVDEAIKVARLAPSAHNNQPWEFNIGFDTVTISVSQKRGKLKSFNRMDCGISLLHLELGAQKAGVHGVFRFLDDPDVAVFQRV